MSKKWLLAFGLIWAGVAFSDGVPTACQPVMRPDKQWWALARHVEIITRLAQAKTNSYDLVLVGDSITHRWENKGNGASVYSKLLSRYGVLNLGCGGDQTQHVLWRFEHGALGSDYPYTAKVFAVMIGVNNGDKDPEGTVAGVKKIVGMIRAKHPESKVLLMAILPHGKNPRNDVSAKVINPMLKAFAAENGCAWLDMGEKFLDENGEIKPGLMMPDDLHPIAGGYEIWLSEMCPVVDGLLGRR